MAKTNSLFLSSSRYVQGGVTEAANNRIEWWEPTSFPNDSTDRVYAIENIYEGNPQAISTVFFKDPRYWWFLCQYNKILDPVAEITAGRVLFIPTLDRMRLMLTGKMGGRASQRELIPTIPPVVV